MASTLSIADTIAKTFENNFTRSSCFVFPGDDGSSEEPQQGVLVKESENLYTLWCTGRLGCDGLLVELKVNSCLGVLVYTGLRTCN